MRIVQPHSSPQTLSDLPKTQCQRMDAAAAKTLVSHFESATVRSELGNKVDQIAQSGTKLQIPHMSTKGIDFSIRKR